MTSPTGHPQGPPSAASTPEQTGGGVAWSQGPNRGEKPLFPLKGSKDDVVG